MGQEVAGDHGAGGGPGAGEVTFIGGATVLISFCGFNVLTDPSFLHSGERANLGLGLRSRRLTEPAMQPGDLPPLDLVVVSQWHSDHFDKKAVTGLDKEVPVVAEPHAARKLEHKGFGDVRPLGTWERTTIDKASASVTAEALPAVRARGVHRAFSPPAMGTYLEFSCPGVARLKVYVTGDTRFGPSLEEIHRRHGSMDICFIHLGGARVAGMALSMDDEEGARLLEATRPRIVVPIHYDDYGTFRSPVEAFLERAKKAQLPTEVREVHRGETWRFEAGNEAAA